MNIVEALQDPKLFGALPAFRDLRPWKSWLAFLKALYGLPLTDDELAIFRKHTGRSVYAPPEGGYREAQCITGRQSGKTRIAALVASYEAVMASQQEDKTHLYALMISQDQRSSLRTIFSYATSPFEAVPMLAPSVKHQTTDTLTLDSGVVLAAYPCRPASARGIRAKVVVLDEMAFYLSTEGNATDTEMVRAVRPCLATTGGKLLILSSPYAQMGALWDLYRQHFGRNDSPVLVWQAAANEMNPTLPADYIERMRVEDPEAYRTEVLGEFRAGIAALFDPEAIEACIVRGRRELPPEPEIRYKAFADSSGGRSDAFTLAIGHRTDDRVIVDALRAWEPPFNPSEVVKEAVALLRSYEVRAVTGDRYAGEWTAQAFRSNGVQYYEADLPRSDLYLEMLPLVNASRVELLDVPEMLKEFRGLERRRGSSGKDRVDHRAGSHDDRANAVAGLVRQLPRGTERRKKIPEAPPADTRELRRRQLAELMRPKRFNPGSLMDPWRR